MKEVDAYRLKNGHTRSCGCLIGKSNITHGQYGTRLYKIYDSMKSRCFHKSNKSYNNYGGKGISVCEEWKNEFESFYCWAISNGYSDELTLDRKDNGKDYSPDNCRWVTMKFQQNNRTNNKLLTIGGETKTLQQWADESGISRSTIFTRIRLGWNDEDLLKQPRKKRKG